MNNNNEIINIFNGTDYLYARGEIEYNMLNDYVFRIVFQENKYALKGLLSSILHLDEDSIIGIEIKNTVQPGVSIADKEYRMDILVTLNNHTTIDLEMQKRDYENWQHRSLAYLCREFDSLDHGDDYNEVKPVYQIGFLDFSLFDEHPEFFATYQMRNARDNHLYTDRFNLIVVSLNQEKIATDEDRAYGIDKWVRLFKAKTWEELKMVASDNSYMTSAVESVYLSNEDKNVRKIAREREDYLRHEAYTKKRLAQLAELEENISSLKADYDNLKADNDNLKTDNNNLKTDNDNLKAELERLKSKLESMNK